MCIRKAKPFLPLPLLFLTILWRGFRMFNSYDVSIALFLFCFIFSLRLSNQRFNRSAIIIQAIQRLLNRHLLIPLLFGEAPLDPSTPYYLRPDLKDKLGIILPCQPEELLLQRSFEYLVNYLLSGIFLQLWILVF